VRMIDPDGEAINLVAAGIGAAIGAGIGAGMAALNGGSGRDIAAAAVSGAVSGGMAGLTMGGSVAVGLASGALASMAGYTASNMVSGKETTVEGLALHGVSGMAGYAGGQLLNAGANALLNAGSSSSTTTSPDFIVDKSGQAFPVPKGATGPKPCVNDSGKITGIGFAGGSGGSNGQVTTMRVMDPRDAIGKAPAYPNGYVTYSNANGQAVNPYSGNTVPRTQAHYPLGEYNE